ncbi:hypothetical protein [Streptomyces sp. NPDC059072]|uniref:hypothetical protein n=1 Tax=Streptomyces sp. NPDC059072 TaxID=3346715 RepID=UPI003680DD6D
MEEEPGLAPWFNAFRPRVERYLLLSEGPLPHSERLRLLRGALAPTADRGSWRSEHDGTAGQDHFAAVDTDWLLTYDRSNPHMIRIGFPPEDGERARRRPFAAVRLMECEVVEITTVARTPLPAWDAVTEEDEGDE